MTRSQRRALKVRVQSNLNFVKREFKRLESVGSRLHLKKDRIFKAAFHNIRKEIRLFRKLNSKL